VSTVADDLNELLTETHTCLDTALCNVGDLTVSAGSAFADLDPLAEALSKLETVDSSPTRSFVAHPNTLLALSELKVATDWNLPLLGPDATSPTRRSVLGVPVYWSPAVDTSTVWLVAQAKSFVVVRQPTSLSD
jgi:Phage capsid family